MKLCVYTSLIGEYEDLNEQEIAHSSQVDFICFTDSPDLTSKTWQIRVVKPDFLADPIRSQRTHKILPHRLLSDYDCSLYIDNSVILKQKPEDLFKKYLDSNLVAMPYHSFREILLDEFIEVSRIELDDPNRIFEQLNHYSIYYPDILQEKPIWSAIIFRKHNSPEVIKAFELWYSQVMRYSRRDQLSVNLGLELLKEKLLKFELDNHESDFHLWPSVSNRDRNRGTRNTYDSKMPGYAKLREKELQLELLNNQLATYQKEIKERQEIKELEQIKKIQEIKEIQIINSELNVEIEFLKKQVSDLKLDLQNHQISYQEQSNELQEVSNKLNLVLNSNSWKLTSYLRNFKEFLSKLKTKPNDIYAECLNGNKIYVEPGDARGDVLIKTKGDFNPHSLAIWKEVLANQDWDSIVDIGANYGEMIINLNHFDYKKILLVEPNPYIKKYLKKSIKKAGIKAEILDVALSEKTSLVELEIDRTWSGLSGISGLQRQTQGHQLEKIQVEAISLEDLINCNLNNSKNAAFKIDIEGNEISVLQNFKEAFRRLNDYSIMIECLHLDDSQIEWLENNFNLYLYNLQKNSLEHVKKSSVKYLIESGQYYNQDIVLKSLN